jgi:2,4-diaminopentanoate dehydrogenase
MTDSPARPAAAIRVALIGTGNCGSLALKQLVNDARFDLTGVWVSSDAKVGKDAGELAGLGVTTGVAATNDLDAIIVAKPDCIVYCAMGDTRLPEAMADIRRILTAGIDVVGSAPGVLQYPWQVIPDKYIERVEDAAREGNSTVFMTGVDPGFATDLLPFALAGTCQSIEQVRTIEIADYATYDGATVMFDVMGFGNQIGDFPMLFQPGVLSIAWGTAIRQLAAGLGIEVDEIKDSVEQEPAPEDFDIAAGHIAKGTVAALRFQIDGMVNGKPVIVVEHVTRLRGDLRPDWAQPAQPGVVPCRDHRRAVLHHEHLPDEPEWRPQLRGHPRGGRPDRERDPRRCCGAARHPDHARYAAGHREGSVRS